MTARCTIKCPTLTKGISRNSSDIDKYNFNQKVKTLTDLMVDELNEVDITCNKTNHETDGTVTISCEDTLANVEKFIQNNNLEITKDRSEIKHRIKELSDETQEEDIDEVFEPLTTGELKKLKSRSVTNQFKVKKSLQV